MTVQIESHAIDPIQARRLRSEAVIDQLEQEIVDLDTRILAAVKRRSHLALTIGDAAMESGSSEIVNTFESKVLHRFRDLGQDGHTVAKLLINLGRGRRGL